MNIGRDDDTLPRSVRSRSARYHMMISELGRLPIHIVSAETYRYSCTPMYQLVLRMSTLQPECVEK